MKIDFKTYWKDYLIIGLVLVGIILGITATHYYKMAITPAQLVAAEKILANPKADILTRFKDNSGQNHAQIKANQNQLPAAALKDSVAKRKGLIDTVKKALNLPDAEPIQEVTRVNAVLVAENIRLKDSLNKAGDLISYYHDKFVDLTFFHASNTVDLVHRVSLTSAKYTPSSWWIFGKKDPRLDFAFDDSRMTITNVDHISFLQPEPLLGFSADGKVSYFPGTGRVVPSAGAQLRVGHFTFEGREYYSYRTNSFQPMVSAGYKFLNIQ